MLVSGSYRLWVPPHGWPIRRGGGRQHLHQAQRVGAGARLRVEDAFGADLGGDPGRVNVVAPGLATDRRIVVQRETQRVQLVLPRAIAQREYRAVEPAVGLRDRVDGEVASAEVFF